VVFESVEPKLDCPLHPLVQVVDRFGRPVRHVRLVPSHDQWGPTRLPTLVRDPAPHPV